MSTKCKVLRLLMSSRMWDILLHRARRAGQTSRSWSQLLWTVSRDNAMSHPSTWHTHLWKHLVQALSLRVRISACCLLIVFLCLAVASADSQIGSHLQQWVTWPPSTYYVVAVLPFRQVSDTLRGVGALGWLCVRLCFACQPYFLFTCLISVSVLYSLSCKHFIPSEGCVSVCVCMCAFVCVWIDCVIESQLYILVWPFGIP